MINSRMLQFAAWGFISLFLTEAASAFVSVGISGNSSSTHSGLEQSSDTSLSASVSFDLGSHFRIGYTHRQSWEKKSGLKIFDSNDGVSVSLENFSETTLSTIKSLDLTIVLYQGQLIVPFVFGGIAWKSYDVSEYSDTKGYRSYSPETDPVWNAGGGLAITLSERFSLKVSKSFSPGKVYTFDSEQNAIVSARRVTDAYTQVGITYKL